MVKIGLFNFIVISQNPIFIIVFYDMYIFKNYYLRNVLLFYGFYNYFFLRFSGNSTTSRLSSDGILMYSLVVTASYIVKSYIFKFCFDFEILILSE